MARENLRPSRSWASRITAGSAGAMGPSSSGGKRRRSGWWRSCMQLRQNCAAGCTSRSRSVGEWLQKVTLGYYQYHAVPGNLDRLRVFGHRLRRLWRRILIRRSQRRRMLLGSAQSDFWIAGFQYPVFCILIPWNASSLVIQGGSRMRYVASRIMWRPACKPR